MRREELVKQIISPIENGIFVEIGTHCGSFADFILENNKSSKLYCVDPYITPTKKKNETKRSYHLYIL